MITSGKVWEVLVNSVHLDFLQHLQESWLIRRVGSASPGTQPARSLHSSLRVLVILCPFCLWNAPLPVEQLRTGPEPSQHSSPPLCIWNKWNCEGSIPKAVRDMFPPTLAMMLCYPAISNSSLLVCRAGACPSGEFSLCSISWHWPVVLAAELLTHSYLSEGLDKMVAKGSHKQYEFRGSGGRQADALRCFAGQDQTRAAHCNRVWQWVSDLWASYYLVFSSFKLSLKRAWNPPGYCQSKTVSTVTSHDFPTPCPFITGVAQRDSGNRDLANCLAAFTSLKQTWGGWALNNLFLVSKEQT